MDRFNGEERRALEQAKHLALMNARAHTQSNFITCDSQYGNLILTVVPRPEDLPTLTKDSK